MFQKNNSNLQKIVIFLKEESESNPQVVLHVNADKETSHRHIVFLLDIATDLGLEELSVGTKMKR